MRVDRIPDFVGEGRRPLSVATKNADGTIHLAVVWFVVLEGRVAFWTYRRSRKARNLHGDPGLTCLAHDGEHYDELAGAMLIGTATLVDEIDRSLEVAVAVYRRYTGEPDAAVLSSLRHQLPKRVAVLMQPQSIVTWDHGRRS